MTTVRVSVVVAVFNTGEFLEPLIASLLGQTLPSQQWEAIFVDDGSTDETPARLGRLAAEHENVTVVHEPNSGWPGRPRNEGTDRAQGRYVFYADHDDWFTPEALERMVAYADACGSDVLVPRYAGHHRGVAKTLFADGNQAAVTLADAPLMDSLTPHKLFRIGFLRDIGLRFPEGRRRLEDHVFVVEAYFRAGRVSVLADYCCYVHIGRPDAGNAGYQRIDPPSYYAYNGEVIEIIRAHTEPGALRDRCLRRPLGTEILARLDGASFLQQDEAYQRSLFDAARELALASVPAEVDRELSPPQRVRAALLRAGRFVELVRYVEHQVGIRARAELTGLAWDGEGRLVIDVDARLVDEAANGAPVAYVEQGGRTLLTVPDALAGVVPDETRDCTDALAVGTASVLTRRREDSEEWPVPIEVRRAIDGDGAAGVRYRGRAVLDPSTLGGGRMLTRGIWDLYVRIEQTGWAKETRLGSVRAPAVDEQRRPALLGDLAVVPYWTETYDNLSIYVGATAGALGKHLDTVGETVPTGEGLRLRLRLALATRPGRPVTAHLQLTPLGGGGVDVDLRDLPVQRVDDGSAVVTAPVDVAGPGLWSVRLALIGIGSPQPTGHVLEVPDGGRARVVPASSIASRTESPAGRIAGSAAVAARKRPSGSALRRLRRRLVRRLRRPRPR